MILNFDQLLRIWVVNNFKILQLLKKHTCHILYFLIIYVWSEFSPLHLQNSTIQLTGLNVVKQYWHPFKSF